MRRDAAGCGGMRRDAAGCGGMRRDAAGCGGERVTSGTTLARRTITVTLFLYYFQMDISRKMTAKSNKITGKSGTPKNN